MTRLEIICAVLGMAGAVVNVLKSPWCFVIWLASNAGLVVYCTVERRRWLTLMYTCYVGLSVWGIVAWW